MRQQRDNCQCAYRCAETKRPIRAGKCPEQTGRRAGGKYGKAVCHVQDAKGCPAKSCRGDIAITTSANFGNMITMAAASLLLPFLPLLPKQILLNNFLSDVPSMAIAKDNVDRELIDRPRLWDIPSLRRFMMIFGSISSAFDFLTFGILLWIFNASAELFRSAWFVEPLLTQLVIVLVLRTYRPFYSAMPSRLLLLATFTTIGFTLILPHLPVAELFDLQPLVLPLLLIIVGITALYAIVSERVKLLLYHRHAPGAPD
jgi:Mg2+-importing ATPase